MFDPSKLNLDFWNEEKKDTKNIPEVNINEQINNSDSIKIEEEKAVTEKENQDFLKIEWENDILNSINSIEIKPINNINENNKEDFSKNKIINDEVIIWESLKNTIEPNIELKIEKKEEVKIKKIEEKKDEEQKIIYDINIVSLQDVLNILADKEYDFVVFEPSEELVKIIFKKDKIDKEVKNIKYPIYSQILIKAKKSTNLEVEQTWKTQEWAWDVNIKNKIFQLIAKTVPDNNNEKLFLKIKATQKEVIKENKKSSLNQIFWFLWAIAFISLIIWWAFTGFIVLNAKTVDDVKFFYSLWINLNDINTFISKIITIIFSILVFIETIFLIVYLFKFSLTKKEFKPKKIRYWIFATIFLIITFITWSGWLLIDKKVGSLPNWQEMSYWDVQLYDNSKLISEKFDKWWALITDSSNIIWPIEIKFDLNFFTQNEEQKWIKIKKFIWNFWGKNEDNIETPNPVIIKNFTEKWNYEVSLIVQEIDLKWDVIEKKVENIPNINLSYIVGETETKLDSWGKLVEFDASSLKELWKIEWYFFEDLTKPVWDWYTFKVWKPIFEETLVWMYIRRNDKESTDLDKVFVISWEDKTNLGWEIIYTRSIDNDLEGELKVDNTKVDFWNWYIEEFKWIIDGKEITNPWNFDNPSEASKIKYTFKNYWKNIVKLILKDSSWNTKELSTVIDISKQLKINSALKIYNNWTEVKDVKYEPKLNEYYIWEVWIPTQIKLDARRVKSDDTLYTLKDVKWDFDSNWDTDSSEKLVTYDANKEWNYNISVEYTFEHIKIKDNIRTIKEKIFFEGVKKEAVIDFDIKNDSNYTPIIVRFDASKSSVKNDDIVKFVWDYWDWVVEWRDAIVPWHKYLVPWDYTIKLKIVTKSWKEYEISKQLTLKAKPQSVKISSSMKQTTVDQSIDFLSSDSEWQIVSYLWDFWDWTNSTEPNPSHSFSKPWTYTISLNADFSNNNVLESKIEIEIIDDTK